VIVKHSLHLIIILILSSLLAACAQEEPDVAPGPKYIIDIPEIEGYQKWHRLSETPRDVSTYIYTLCRMPTDDELTFADSEHGRSRWLLDYVNEAGLHAMTLEADPAFPPGSIIVKEKYASLDAAEPEALGVMIKHDQGYNPNGGDWEFIYWDQQQGVFRTAEQSAYCQACHQTASGTDFVFRPYVTLPDQ
jgi:hypothetical protein